MDIEDYFEWQKAIQAFDINEYRKLVNVAIHAQTPNKKIASERNRALTELENEKQRLLFGEEWDYKKWENSHKAVKRLAKAGKIRKK